MQGITECPKGIENFWHGSQKKNCKVNQMDVQYQEMYVFLVFEIPLSYVTGRLIPCTHFTCTVLFCEV